MGHMLITANELQQDPRLGHTWQVCDFDGRQPESL